MIDYDDVDDMTLITVLTDNPIAFFLLAILTCVVLYVACSNDDACRKMACPVGQSPTLMAHKCLCATEAR